MADEASATIKQQKNQLDDLIKQRARTRKWLMIWVGLCGVTFTVALIPIISAKDGYPAEIILGTAPYVVIFLIAALTLAARRRELDNEIRETRFEVELSEHPISPREVRVERLFRMNQHKLRKYYDLNRNQNRLIAGVGII